MRDSKFKFQVFFLLIAFYIGVYFTLETKDVFTLCKNAVVVKISITFPGRGLRVYVLFRGRKECFSVRINDKFEFYGGWGVIPWSTSWYPKWYYYYSKYILIWFKIINPVSAIAMTTTYSFFFRQYDYKPKTSYLNLRKCWN